MGKVSTYLRLIEERVHIKPKSMATYAPIALVEYKAYVNFQKLMEANGKTAPRSMIPFNLLPSSVKS